MHMSSPSPPLPQVSFTYRRQYLLIVAIGNQAVAHASLAPSKDTASLHGPRRPHANCSRSPLGLFPGSPTAPCTRTAATLIARPRSKTNHWSRMSCHLVRHRPPPSKFAGPSEAGVPQLSSAMVDAHKPTSSPPLLDQVGSFFSQRAADCPMATSRMGPLAANSHLLVATCLYTLPSTPTPYTLLPAIVNDEMLASKAMEPPHLLEEPKALSAWR
mmetsp:Transcript_95284/g.308619  ORF Transcript_95284/g.308619 Transcript_95284/m.308619 type:complete len:215 (+) Transcript_95284:1544-2188(+)